MKWVAHSLQGRREENEDYHVVPTRKQHAKGEVWPLAVFDGHGGNRVSSYLKRSLVPGLLAHPKKCFQARYLKDCFRRTSAELGKKHPKVATDMGSTAAVVLVRKDGMVVCCNVGDSRAVLCRGGLALPLSVDHKPNAPDERARIEQAGGKIKRDGPDYRIQGLAVSRAFGDLDTSPYVTPAPDVRKIKLTREDTLIIVACDGLWDVMSNQDAVDLVRSGPVRTAAARLAQKAYDKGSTDNITVVVAYDLPIPKTKSKTAALLKA